MCEKCKALAEQQSKADFGPEVVSINTNNIQAAHIAEAVGLGDEFDRIARAEELLNAVTVLHDATVEIVLQYVNNRKLGADVIDIKPEIQYLENGVVNHLRLGLGITILSSEGVGINDQVLIVPVDTNVKLIADEIVRQFTARVIENELEKRKNNTDPTIGGH